MIARNARRLIGILFVGKKLFKIVVLGIVTYVEYAKTGGSGIVRSVINVRMDYRCHVKIAEKVLSNNVLTISNHSKNLRQNGRIWHGNRVSGGIFVEDD